MNALYTCACGTRADGSTAWPTVAVVGEKAGSPLSGCEQDTSAARSETAADGLAGTRPSLRVVMFGVK